MRILAIETSCDETAAALVEDGVVELCSVVASSKDFHLKTGGIVPEVAARKQVEFMVPVLDQLVEKFNARSGDAGNPLSFFRDNIDALAVTVGPGLIGSLLIGVEAAKSLALVWEKPLIPVNHLVGHIYSNWIDTEVLPELPAIVLIVSGGHTDLVLMRDHGDLEFLGGTLDDAVGEAFDKTARLLGLARYLGGKELADLSATCTKNLALGKLPRPLMDSKDLELSFSGLKTAAKRMIQSDTYPADSIACEFETAAVDVLVAKTVRAVKKYGVNTVLLGGGVSANTALRARLRTEMEALGITLHVPPLRLCTDNAVYIASAAFFNNTPKDIAEINANPSLGITDKI
jgi:N6-L-threonylcarbamoyladenine synthase